MTSPSDSLPLAGLRVLVTRSRSQARSLCAALEAQGARLRAVPALAFGPPEDWGPLDEALAHLGDFQWAAFTSANGVRFTLRRLQERGGTARDLAALSVAAVGQATTVALARRGLRPDLVPSHFTGEALRDALLQRLRPGERLLLPRGDLADQRLPHSLEEAGIPVCSVVVYRSRAPARLAERARGALAEGVDIAIFASPSAVANLLAALGGDGSSLRGASIACIGPTTAQAARDAGLAVDVEAREQSAPGLVQALIAWRGGLVGAEQGQAGAR